MSRLANDPEMLDFLGLNDQGWPATVDTKAVLPTVAGNPVAMTGGAYESADIDWSNPPSWAREWDDNDLVFYPETDGRPFEQKREVDIDLSSLGEALC